MQEVVNTLQVRGAAAQPLLWWLRLSLFSCFSFRNETHSLSGLASAVLILLPNPVGSKATTCYLKLPSLQISGNHLTGLRSILDTTLMATLSLGAAIIVLSRGVRCSSVLHELKLPPPITDWS